MAYHTMKSAKEKEKTICTETPAVQKPPYGAALPA